MPSKYTVVVDGKAIKDFISEEKLNNYLKGQGLATIDEDGTRHQKEGVFVNEVFTAKIIRMGMKSGNQS